MTKKSITLEVDPSIMENNMRIVKENPIEEELKNMFAFDTTPYKLVKPTPGFCIKTFTKLNNKKLFVNICQTNAIPCPKDISNEELLQILNSEDPSNFRVPMSLGEGRTEHDKSGAEVTVYDIAIHPDFYEKIQDNELFLSFFLTVAFEGLEDKYQIDIDMNKRIILKNRKCIGTLQSHRIQIRDIQQIQSGKPPSLIEEISNAPANQGLNNRTQIVHRLRREPPTGEIEYLQAEFKIPASVDLKDLKLEVGEDRLVLDSKGVFDIVDFFLPCNVDQDVIDAQLNRNHNILTVKMPAI